MNIMRMVVRAEKEGIDFSHLKKVTKEVMEKMAREETRAPIAIGLFISDVLCKTAQYDKRGELADEIWFGDEPFETCRYIAGEELEDGGTSYIEECVVAMFELPIGGDIYVSRNVRGQNYFDHYVKVSASFVQKKKTPFLPPFPYLPKGIREKVAMECGYRNGTAFHQSFDFVVENWNMDPDRVKALIDQLTCSA